jgi:hypothetical protein
VAAEFDQYCMFKTLAGSAADQEDAARAEVQPKLVRMALKEYLKAGAATANPVFQSAASRLTMVITRRNQAIRLADQDGQERTLADEFVAAGVPADRADGLATLFNRQRVLDMVPLAQLREKSPRLADKVLRLLRGLAQDEADQIKDILTAAGRPDLAQRVAETVGLTREEVPATLTRATEYQATVREPSALLGKMVAYCDTPDELEAAFRTVKAEYRLTGLRYSGDLTAAAGQIAAPPAPAPARADDGFTTADGKYRAGWSGKVVTLMDARSLTPVGTKECKDALHARNTARKLVSNSTYLKQFLAEFGK